jgi:hypothetical protein
LRSLKIAAFLRDSFNLGQTRSRPIWRISPQNTQNGFLVWANVLHRAMARREIGQAGRAAIARMIALGSGTVAAGWKLSIRV